jgi:hypothetical protein
VARPLFAPPRRAERVVEATPAQIAIAGGGLGSYAVDPIDGDRNYRRLGGELRREVPEITRERARDSAVTAYRMNPMAAAIIDTLVSFCVGDSGVSPMCTHPQVAQVVDEFWTSPWTNLGGIQEVSLRSLLLLGEKLYELMEGPTSGVVGFAPIEPSQVYDITHRRGNPLWPDEVILRVVDESTGEKRRLRVAQAGPDGLRYGQCFFWTPWRALDTDTRGVPFLHSVLDHLDSYDQVLSNLVDRTALARYIAYDVTLKGPSADVDKFVRDRGGTHLPPSGTIEVHNESVEWKPMTVTTGADEDTRTAGAVLTSVAAGSGLARTWLADPEDANRATSMSMAEPVRRRVGGVQRVWLDIQTQLCRYVVDRAVAARRLKPQVEVTDPKTGVTSLIPASMSVVVRGPAIAAADAQVTAQVMLNLATGLEKLVGMEILSPQAARLAAQFAWEQYMGVPYRAELDSPEANADELAGHVDERGDPGKVAQLWPAA